MEVEICRVCTFVCTSTLGTLCGPEDAGALSVDCGTALVNVALSDQLYISSNMTK